MALGDSITGDINYGVAPHPPRLAGMLGQTVINEGNGGETSGGGAGKGEQCCPAINRATC